MHEEYELAPGISFTDYRPNPVKPRPLTTQLPQDLASLEPLLQ
jgi:hypothetical protein